MTKAELIDIIAEDIDLTKAQIGEVYEKIFETILRAVKEDDKHRFLVKDFGTFELKHRNARKGRNPATGQEIDIPAKNTLNFRPAKAAEDTLN